MLLRLPGWQILIDPAGRYREESPSGNGGNLPILNTIREAEFGNVSPGNLLPKMDLTNPVKKIHY